MAIQRMCVVLKKSSKEQAVPLFLKQRWPHFLKKYSKRMLITTIETGAPKLDELDPTLEISYQTLLEDTSKYLWQAVDHFERLQEGSLYIHSDAQPLGDFDPNYQPFLDLLAEKHIEFVRLACSGHAKPDDLDRIIAMIEPKCLVPIHTLKTRTSGESVW